MTFVLFTSQALFPAGLFQNVRVSVYSTADANLVIAGTYCLNIYGPKKEAKGLGAYLSSKKYFLQLPKLLDTQIQYFNPQYLNRKSHALTPCRRVDGESTTHGQNCIHKEMNSSDMDAMVLNSTLKNTARSSCTLLSSCLVILVVLVVVFCSNN